MCNKAVDLTCIFAMESEALFSNVHNARLPVYASFLVERFQNTCLQGPVLCSAGNSNKNPH